MKSLAPLTLVSLVLFASSARAATDAEAPESPPVAPATVAPASPHPVASSDTHWYGYQLFLVDVAALTIPMFARVPAVSYVATGAYAIGPAVVHAIHGRSGAAAGSIALRLGLPIAFAYAGAAMTTSSASSDREGYAAFGGALIGGLSGMATAILIDDIALAREPVAPAVVSGQGAKRHSAVSFVPQVTPTRGGAVAGLSGTF